MARSAFVFALCAFFLASIPPSFAGPGCARRLQGDETCPSQCAKRWGWPGRSMGTDRWGNVVEVTVTDFAAGSVVTKMCKLRPESASPPVSSATAAVGNAASQPSIVPNPIANITSLLSSVTSTSSVTFSTASSSSSSARNSTSSIAPSTSSSSKPAALTAVAKPLSPASSTPSATSSSPPPPKSTSSSKQPEPSPEPQPQPAPSANSEAPPADSPADQGGSKSSNSGGGNAGSNGSSDGDIQQYLSAHNSVRAQHGAAPLTWSDEAAAKAQQWANGCVFEHSGGSLGPFGENLAAGTGGSYDIAAAVKSWTDEVSEYNPNNPQASHFTQVVWKGSTQVGCALQLCDGIFDASFGKAKFFVCEYTPQGNIIGQFAQNVQLEALKPEVLSRLLPRALPNVGHLLRAPHRSALRIIASTVILHHYAFPSAAGARPLLRHNSTQSSVQQTAPAHATSTPFQLFVNEIEESANSASLDRVRQCFDEYFTDVNSLLPPEYAALESSKATIVKAIGLLTQSGDLSYVPLIDHILQYMHNHWQMPVTRAVHDVILQGFFENGDNNTALRWLTQMTSKPGGCIPTEEQWHTFLLKCKEAGSSDLARLALLSMHRSGCPPTQPLFELVVDVMYRGSSKVPVFGALKEVVEAMRSEGLSFTEPMFKLVRERYQSIQAHALAAKAKSLFEEAAHVQDVKESKDINRRREELLADIVSEPGGRRQAVGMLAQYRNAGFVPTLSTLGALTRNVSRVEGLKFWEARLGIQADNNIWVTVIRNGAQENLYDGLECLRTVFRRGIVPTPAMLYPVVRALCMKNFGRPPESAIDEALALHQQYLERLSEALNTGDELPPATADDLPLYNSILRAVTSSKNTAKYFPIAVSIMEQMLARNTNVDYMTSTTMVVLLMRSTSSYREAYEVYKKAMKTKEGRYTLDAKGYAVVLDAFCNLPFARLGTGADISYVPLYLQIVQDMRDAGYSISAEVYTILLRQLARMATEVPPEDEESQQRVAITIQRMHDMITIDGSLVPDIALWNQLMDAYQRAGCFQEAYKLWRTMFISRKFDHATVSIIMDACAYSGSVRTAAEIYEKLHRSGFRLNQRNWVNWLECLCRLGKLDDAVKLFCLEMKKRGATPTADAVKLLLRFAMRHNVESQVKSRIKTYLPEFWNSLPREVKYPGNSFIGIDDEPR
ncbi:hypothetical protein K474DRAFT_1696318 [Panus rudis PR-1116 ss-1]|nr:hypothetical protein K474DRAFT_1696318 [Panus rudis PR-1116 ss-1]